MTKENGDGPKTISKNSPKLQDPCPDITETCSDVPETFGGIRKHSNFGNALNSNQFFSIFSKKSKFRASQRTRWDALRGLLLALQAECPWSTSSIPTSVRAIKVADGSRFVWLLTG